jgi:hypothetical protein
LAAVLLSAGTHSAPASAEDWRFGDFQIEWPNGYVRQPTPGLERFRNPDGVIVTVDTLGPAPTSGEAGRQAVEHWEAYGRNQMVATAARHGAVVIPLHEETLASGAILMSVADERRVDGQEKFGLLFLVIAPDSRVAQIVVEGPGSAEARMGEFRPLFATAHWRSSLPVAGPIR